MQTGDTMASSSTPLRKPTLPAVEGEEAKLRASIVEAFDELDRGGGEDGEPFMDGLIAELEVAAAPRSA
jgi:hypothetical protein